MAQVQVKYDGNAIIPVSTLGLKLAMDRSGDGTVRRRYWQLSLAGTLLPWKGSPQSDGSFWSGTGYPPDGSGTFNQAFEALQLKKQALVTLFEQSGKLFEISPTGGTNRTCRPRWNEVDFAPGREINNIPWTVVGEADYISGLDEASPPGQADSPPEESWNLERVDEVGRQYRLTHTVTSQQKSRFDLSTGTETPGWQLAKDFILGTGLAGSGASSRLGFQSAMVNGSGSVLTDLSAFVGYNYVRQQTVDEAQGRFSVVEKWDLFDPNDNPSNQSAGYALEELTVEDRYTLDTGFNTVTVSISVTGHEQRGDDYTVISTRTQNMQARMSTFTSSVLSGIAGSTTGYSLNPVPLSTTVIQNASNGHGQVTAVFDTRPGNSSSLYLSELVNLEIDLPVAVIPEIPVPFRSLGPIPQTTGTITQGTVTVSLEIRVRVAYGVVPVEPSTNPLPYVPTALGYIPGSVWLKSDRIRWNPKTGSYVRTSVFAYQG